MESIPYIDELINEYLLFRGFIKSFTTFNTEKQMTHHTNNSTSGTSGNSGATVGGGNIPTDVDGLCELIHSHINALEVNEFIDVWSTLRSKFFIHLDTNSTTPGQYEPLIRSMEIALKKSILVKAFNKKRMDKVRDTLDVIQTEIATGSTPPSVATEWAEWMTLPYCSTPSAHPIFAPYFHRRWYQTLTSSLKNFLTTLFKVLPLPRILAFNIEREKRKKMTLDLRSTKSELERVKAELHTAQTQLSQMKNQGYRIYQRTSVTPNPDLTPSSNSSHSIMPHRSSTTATAPTPTTQPSPNSSATTPTVAPVLSEPFAISTTLIDLNSDAAPFVAQSTHLLLGHSGPVLKARFSNEGSYLATLSSISSDLSSADGDAIDSSAIQSHHAQTKLWSVDGVLNQQRIRAEMEEDDALRRDEKAGRLRLPSSSSLAFGQDGDDTTNRTKIRSSNDKNRSIDDESVASSAFMSSYSSSLDGGQLHPFASWNHSSPLSTLTFSKSDSYLMTGSSSDGRIGVWSLPGTSGSTSSSPKLRAEFVVGMDSSGFSPYPVVLDLVTSPNDQFVIAASATKMHCECGSGSLTASSELQGVLEKYDLTTGKRSMVFQAAAGSMASTSSSHECTQVNSIALTHNANMLLSGSADGLIRVWDTRQDTRTSQAMIGWSAHASSAVSCLRLCSDETTVLSAGLDGSLNEWSLHRMGKVVRELRMPTQSSGQSTPSYSSSTEFLARPEFALDTTTKYAILSEGFGWNSNAGRSHRPSIPSAKDSNETPPRSYLYSLAHSDPAQAVEGHAGPVLSVDWHPVADLIATAAVDHTARIVAVKKKPNAPSGDAQSTN